MQSHTNQISIQNDLPLSLLFGLATKEDSTSVLSEAARVTPLRESILHRKLQHSTQMTMSRSSSLMLPSKITSEFQPKHSSTYSLLSLSLKNENHEHNRKTLSVMVKTHPFFTNINHALDSTIWTSIIIIATLFALFADDVTKALLPKEADVYEKYLIVVSFVLFGFDIFSLSIFRDKYFGGLFFW